MLLKLIMYIFSLNVLVAAPVAFDSLGNELENFSKDCKVYQKITLMPHSVQKKCKQFNKDLKKTFNTGYKLDAIIASGKENDKLLNKYLNMLRKTDEKKETIITLVNKVKVQAREDSNHKVYQQIIQIKYLQLYSSDYTFMETNKDIYIDNEQYKRYITKKKEKEFELQKQKQIKKEKSLNDTYSYGMRLYNGYYYKKAEKVMISAAKQGHKKAQKFLLELYTNGKGDVKKDSKKVQLWKNKINLHNCSLAKEQACLDLMNGYMNGHVEKNDKAEVLKIFSNTCDGGDISICKKLGYIYQNGRGVKKDLRKAIPRYKKACKNNDSSSCIRLGSIYTTIKDSSTAVKFYEKACFMGISDMCTKVLKAYKKQKNNKKIIAISEYVCKLGDGAICQEMGYMYKEKNKIKKAIPFFHKACMEGFSESCIVLAEMYIQGSIVGKDLLKATKLYEQACNNGNDLICKKLSIFRQKKHLVKNKTVHREKSNKTRSIPIGNLKQDFKNIKVIKGNPRPYYNNASTYKILQKCNTFLTTGVVNDTNQHTGKELETIAETMFDNKEFHKSGIVSYSIYCVDVNLKYLKIEGSYTSRELLPIIKNTCLLRSSNICPTYVEKSQKY